MRVIAGKARHLKLKTIEGPGTRPTTDRIKETLFNILSFDIPGSSFLDLFAGSGGIWIEALSRGADEAVFVENNRKACACIRDNLAYTHLADQAEVLEQDVVTAISRLEVKKKSFDIIFMDPPYGRQWEQKVLGVLAGSPVCHEDTLIIVESALDTAFPYLEELGLHSSREKVYKTNKHTFITKDER